MPLDDSAMSLLHDAQRHCAAFEKSERCFWVFSEEYEGGGGEDYEVAPYNVDLRDRRVWLTAINEQIALKHSAADRREMQKVAQVFTEYLDTHPNLD
ncbi:MAG: hypothetical protein BWK72_14110 [Rhodoferax ferrireducens]|uniref:PH domain-containing protein n=1 Tax=Rhodoferax ferrireducens TaxID=192843 RepID=A0A1W9KSK5_9BURK|nr:MAG: hypothetical protein BWK72_14110 [Rhodoferax ferrireducens]